MRGQTTLDFAIGMGLFLVTLAFVLAFVPSIFDPFTTGSSAKLIVADRAAATLAGDLLAPSTAGPGSLSTGCVVAFVEENGTLADEECASDIDVEADLDETLSLGGRNVNVSIHPPAEDAESSAEIEWDGSSVRLTRANSKSVPRDVGFAVRIVRIDGQQYRLTVRVW